MLRGHPKVKNWQVFTQSLRPGATCTANENGYGLCIPHARTNEVSGMVMAAGRSRAGIVFPSAEVDGEEVRVYYLLVVGVPVALAQEYLRTIGALARTFRSTQGEFALRSARTPDEFIETLAAGVMKG